jgi:predicted peroxiredoxin
MKKSIPVLMALGLLVAFGFARSAQEEEKTHPDMKRPVLLLNVTSGAAEDPHAVTMALQLAGHALDDGRKVVLFFNVRGVDVPLSDLPADLAFKDKPIKDLLSNLIEQGAEVHVCPHCMKALEVEAGELVEGAVVTDREKLFSNLGPNTVVFTY